MAVVVQRLVNAESAGVLFTCDPFDPSGETMLIEAAWGLGEAVVSGLVSPDRFQLDRASGTLRTRELAAKRVQVTPHGQEPVPSERQQAACLDEHQLRAIAELRTK